MSPNPSFSVIVAVFNGEATIRRAIESVLEQTEPALELIVVDDGSKDRTAEEVARFGDRVRCLHQANAGVSSARNAGVAAARGDWLAFLDADDWYYPDRLKWHAEWIREEPSLDFLTGNFDYCGPDGSFIRRSMESTTAGSLLLEKSRGARRVVMEGREIGQFAEQHFGDTHTLSVPRRTFLELGGYPVGFSVCEDVNLLIRLCARSSRVGVVCEPMAVYTVHENSATRSDPLRAQRQTVAALEVLRPDVASAPPSVRAGLEAAIRNARLDLATVLVRRKRRLEAARSVLPLVRMQPGLRSVREVLSVLKG